MINKLLPNESLCPVIWAKDDSLIPEVREKLLLVAYDFKKFLNLEDLNLRDKARVIDVRFTGSLANFQYNHYSDVDLHLVFDYSKLSEEEALLVEPYFQARKALWNQEHNIDIFGYEVEVYPENAQEEHLSSGVYSIARDEWIIEPTYRSPEVDKELVAKKAMGLISIIDAIAQEDMKPTDIIKSIGVVQDKIKKMRKESLAEAGEFSIGNLVFKVLRNAGYLDTLEELRTSVFDRAVSLSHEE